MRLRSALLLLSGCIACGGASDSTAANVAATLDITPPPGPIAQRTTTTLTVTAKSAAGAVITGASIQWQSLDAAIASVSTSGVVTPGKPGTARIVARSGAAADTVTITVTMTWLAIRTSGSTTCGIGGDSTAYCWGTELVEFPKRSSSVPLQVPGGNHFTTIESSGLSACGLTAAGATYCWGLIGPRDDRYVWPPAVSTPVDMKMPVPFVRLSLGGGFGCGLTAAGDVYCWGNDDYGQIGDGIANMPSTRAATRVPGIPRITTVAAGGTHVCALAANGAAYCWGGNFWGTAGVGTQGYVMPPGPVVGGLTFSTLASGYARTCGVVEGAGLYCWGAQYAGTLADASPSLRRAESFTSLSLGDYSSCGMKPAGLMCWGDASYGLLGNGSTTPTVNTVPVIGGESFAQVSVGNVTACALTRDGVAYCWGTNNNGEIGDGTQVIRSTPTRVLDPAP